MQKVLINCHWREKFKFTRSSLLYLRLFFPSGFQSVCAHVHDSWGAPAPLDPLFLEGFCLSAAGRINQGWEHGSSPSEGRGPAPEKCTQSAVTVKALAHTSRWMTGDLFPGGGGPCALVCFVLWSVFEFKCLPVRGKTFRVWPLEMPRYRYIMYINL